MRLEKVTGRPFQIICLNCGEKLYAGDVEANSTRYPVFADLDGEPWKAYYCAQCADWLRIGKPKAAEAK